MKTTEQWFQFFEGFTYGALNSPEYDDQWRSLKIDYHKPYVNRIWIPYNDFRICCHEIIGCNENEALNHPHPWEADFKAYTEGYRMKMGHGIDEPLEMQEIVLKEMEVYSMEDPNDWHKVYPEKTVYSIMISRVMYDADVMNPNCKKADKELEPLSPEEAQRLKNKFSEILLNVYKSYKEEK